jgi:hypothetical protein
MSKAASDTDGVTYAPTTHKSLLCSSPYMHVEVVHDMDGVWYQGDVCFHQRVVHV